ncbi:MAG: M28 family peptidase [Chloroflexi bacterium]|nr:M28 family peptidase [Chloroflexota bacterium]
MAKRISFLFFALILLVVFAGIVYARPRAPLSEYGDALLYVPLSTPDDLTRFERTGLPVYARLHGRGGEYVLTGSDSARDVLSAVGLSARVLDVDIAGAFYYLVYSMPGRPYLDWTAYGDVLLDDSVQVLLRTSPQDAERLAEAGAELRALTFDPKPIYPSPSARTYSADIAPDPLIQSMIDQVESSTVYSYTGDLSGEWSVEIGGSPYTITTRNTYSGLPLQKATQFVGEHLAALGLDVEYHTWNASYPPNVIGELTGEFYPDEIVIICGHLDNLPQGLLAPGADDNASGSVATLIAADIFAQHRWAYTLRFALWTGEEQGLLGSGAYAQRAYNASENIVGVLNLDMIAWNTLGSNPDMDIHAKSSIPGALDLANLFVDVVNAYDLDLIPRIVSNGASTRSDHASFWDYGYTAIFGIEDDYITGDFNPYYHTVNDLLANLNLDYYTDFVKASVGTFAYMGSPLKGYLTGSVSYRDTGEPIPGAIVETTLNPTLVWTATTGISGVYQLQVPSGIYTVTVTAPGYTSAVTTSIVVQTNQTNTLDVELTTCVPVVGVDFDYDPSEPWVWETVFFTGTATGGTAEMPVTYIWDFDDGITRTVRTYTVTHTFPSETTVQTYTVSLTIANGCLSKQEVEKDIIVRPSLYVAYLPLVLKNY